jgi:hypothetical protein
MPKESTITALKPFERATTASESCTPEKYDVMVELAAVGVFDGPVSDAGFSLLLVLFFAGVLVEARFLAFSQEFHR